MYDLTFDQAMQALKEGGIILLHQHTEPGGTTPFLDLESPQMVKLPEWGGYWFNDGGTIKVMTKDGEITDTPWYDQYKDRNDWQTTDGLRDFAGILPALKAGANCRRAGWEPANFVTAHDGGIVSFAFNNDGETYVTDIEAVATCDIMADDWMVLHHRVEGQECPECHSPEIDNNSPETKYQCGSTDYDQRPGTFKKGENCNPNG